MGFYGKEANSSFVTAIEGEAAIKKFTDTTGEFEKPILMQVYHPECPHCQEAIKDYENIAKLV